MYIQHCSKDTFDSNQTHAFPVYRNTAAMRKAFANITVTETL